jgi:hypothetical protein
MEGVEEPETTCEQKLRRGPTMLLLLLLSFFASSPAFGFAQNDSKAAGISQLDVRAKSCATRQTVLTARATKPPLPAALLNATSGVVSRILFRPGALDSSSCEASRPATHRTAYRARAPPAR